MKPILSELQGDFPVIQLEIDEISKLAGEIPANFLESPPRRRVASAAYEELHGVRPRFPKWQRVLITWSS